MIKLAVFGNPIKQSKSPVIHKMFAEQFNLDLAYTANLAPIDSFKHCVQQFLDDPQVKGCNVTAPFKLEAHAFADELSDVAQIAGAVNTLTKQKDGRIIGDNTDGGGLVNDMLNQRVKLSDSNILLVGAGGAARGVLLDLLKQQPATLTIVNRTQSTADTLVDICNRLSATTECKSASFATLESRNFDVIINATTLSLDNKIPDLHTSTVNGASLVYDMVYKNEPTAFMQWATENGAKKVSDGLGMLVGQAALSFKIWTGFFPDSADVITMLRK